MQWEYSKAAQVKNERYLTAVTQSAWVTVGRLLSLCQRDSDTQTQLRAPLHPAISASDYNTRHAERNNIAAL